MFFEHAGGHRNADSVKVLQSTFRKGIETSRQHLLSCSTCATPCLCLQGLLRFRRGCSWRGSLLHAVFQLIAVALGLLSPRSTVG